MWSFQLWARLSLKFSTAKRAEQTAVNSEPANHLPSIQTLIILRHLSFYIEVRRQTGGMRYQTCFSVHSLLIQQYTKYTIAEGKTPICPSCAMRGTEFLLEKARIRHKNRLSIENVPQHSGNNYINSLGTITLILYACMLITFRTPVFALILSSSRKRLKRMKRLRSWER